MATTNQTLHSVSPGPHSRRADVLICGGGIGGLSLAAWLARAGVTAHLLDRNARPGGVMRSMREDGFMFEHGPNTVLDKHASLDELIAWAGLEEEAIRVPLASQARHVWLNGRLHKVPTGPGSFLKTPLLPMSAKLRLLREPFVKAKPQDESIADFTLRRLGEAVLTNLVTPMIGGIWAGNPEQLSVEAAFPLLKELERDGGSLMRGAIRRSKKNKAAGKKRGVRNMVTFRGGLETLPEAIARKLGEFYRPSTRVLNITPLPEGGFCVETEQHGERETWQACELVVTAEAKEAAGWLQAMDSEAAALLSSFHYTRLVVASLGIAKTSASVPEGFGFLVPRGQTLRILGAIVPSNFFPGRAPEGCAAMSVFIGGELDQSAFEMDDVEIEGIVKRNLRTAIGWNGEARTLRIERWPRSIPQYDMRHAERMRQAEAIEKRLPGLHLSGNWRGGVSVPDRIERMKELAETIGRKFEARNSKFETNSNGGN